jgi:hypothetical protein
MDEALIRWLELLPNHFFVFADIEGADFRSDFLVINQEGIANIEANDDRVLSASSHTEWILEDGKQFRNPFPHLLDQNQKIVDYLLVQRNNLFFPRAKAEALWELRAHLRILPIVALTKPSNKLVHSADAWRKVFADSTALRRFLSSSRWSRLLSSKFILSNPEIERIAGLLKAERIDPSQINHRLGPVTRATATTTVLEPGQNPYQYTFVVTGQNFFGRERELLRIQQGLRATPAVPVSIIGLQRTGKSSLAKEAIRRIARDPDQYRVIEFDFRRLQSEPRGVDQDISFDFIRELATGGATKDLDIATLEEKASHAPRAEQQRLFIEALLSRRARHKRTILFLDECQEVHSLVAEEHYKRFFVYIDALCRDHTLGLNVILASRPSFFQLDVINAINLGRLFNPITLGALGSDAARSVIDSGASVLDFETSAKDRILAITGGHPFWVQFLCHRIFEQREISGNHRVTAGIVDDVFLSIVTDPGCKSQFYLLYQEVEDNKIAMSILKTLASVPDEGNGVPLRSLRIDGPDKQEVSKALRMLSDNQIVNVTNIPHDPHVSFAVDALKQWMRLNLVML